MRSLFPNSRLVVLIFVNYYLPGFRGGGPIRTIANLVESLGEEFDFRIVTMDRDFGDQRPYDSINVDDWNRVGKAQVFYASSRLRSFGGIIHLIRNTPHDVLYLNSFFSAKFTIMPLLARKLGLVQRTPVVLAPRGEFSAGAFKLKRWKKTPFTLILRWLGICDGVLWHSSTSLELADIQRAMNVDSSRIHIACNITRNSTLVLHPNVTKRDSELLQSKVFDGLSICFLSRISPMKNLDFALRLLAQVKAPLQFYIYGPKESSEYWHECEALIKQLPKHVEVLYCGSVENAKVRETIAKHDLFFLPSRGENFGHVFIEALSAGVPILVSDKTPWRGLMAQKLGWDISLDRPDEFVFAIETAASFNSDTRAMMSERCVRFAQKLAEDSGVLDMNRKLFIKAIDSRNIDINSI